MPDGEDKILELKVGIFIAVGILIFFIVVFSIGDVYLIRRGYHLDVVFNFVNGLTKSSPVRVAGVNVGQVDQIDIFYDREAKKTKIKLSAWINDDSLRIEQDSQVFINTLGLLGEKYLEISPGTAGSGFFKAGDTVIGRDPISTEAITAKINTIVDSADIIMGRLAKGEGTAGKFLTEDKVYENVESFTEDIKKHPWKLLHKTREK